LFTLTRLLLATDTDTDGAGALALEMLFGALPR